MNDIKRQRAFVCPSCLYEDLGIGYQERVGELLFCARCSANYPVHFGVPHLIDLRALLRLPEELLAIWFFTQQRVLPLYQENTPASCSLAR
jgi:uncharacterized protein YbaR (Trm112 family)